MFTINQIKEAHSKVKSGADFPAYVQDLIKLGVKRYETFVSDAHTSYQGSNGFEIRSNAMFPALEIANQSRKVQFQKELKEHQQGKSSFSIFREQAANAGVEKWVSDLEKMTCIYYDKAENEILVETIPVP